MGVGNVNKLFGDYDNRHKMPKNLGDNPVSGVESGKATTLALLLMKNGVYVSMAGALAISQSLTAQGVGTIRNKPADELGRNDPCPCGCGKKVKKCTVDSVDAA